MNKFNPTGLHVFSTNQGYAAQVLIAQQRLYEALEQRVTGGGF